MKPTDGGDRRTHSWLLRLVIVAGTIGAVVGSWSWVPDNRSSSPDRAAAFTPIRWGDLIPKEWDPTKRFRALNLESMNDADPQTNLLLTDMRATWDNAPTVAALDGHAVSLSGYVVPLEHSRGAMKEFLLVPYFGACIHTPPPPANQIVRVTADMLQVELRSMGMARVSGTLRTARYDSAMGVSGYSLEALRVESDH